ncbi:N-acetyltransferase [Bacillus sp. MRMR6]|uniref:GNAT family N-acetyltransferase n=1 Tax=Bacillus sp. MRMR6 TaxID=1928617 RepID=UPI00095259CB|nr:GNAT family N-acetyltransferase [Bacillus sp. MRMR6]OLS33716.1 GNAT family N-acetyltransferase [Bacillus sp. MRMR6]
MTIRKATYLETQKILNYSLIVMQESTMGFVKPSQEKAKFLLGPFLSNGGYYLVYTKQNVIQGWVGIMDMIDNNSDEPIGFINEIYVLPPYRNLGIANKLCLTVFNHFKAAGCKQVQLNVYAGNPAKKLYHKLGFEDVSSLMAKKL